MSRKFKQLLICIAIALICFAITPMHALAQSRQITGMITDEAGSALTGATIIVKGTTTGTISDYDGNYTITVPDNTAILHFAYIGYTSIEQPVGTRRQINVTLPEDIAQLEEIVVVGYGAVRKKDLTGSVASVNAGDISLSPTTNMMQAIQGRVPGVYITNTSTRPGESPNVLIRGKRSINAGSDPLYIVDGMPFMGNMNDLAPGDIESIDILKDASATAIYGARGSNGVILITTKKGKEGKTVVDYHGRVGVQSILNELDLMNAPQYAEMIREAYRAIGEYDSDVPSWELDQTIPVFKDDAYTLESLRMAYDSQGNYDPSKVRSDSEWWKAVQRTGIINDQQVSIRGGNSKTNFLVGGGYYNEKGIMDTEEFTRYSIRVNLEHRINKHLKIGTQSMFSHSLQERGPNLYGSSSYKVMPMGRLWDENGELMWRVSGIEDQMLNPLQKTADGAASSPLRRSNFLGNYYAEIQLPVEGLRFRSNLGLEFTSIQDYDFMSAIARAAQVNSNKNGQDYRNSYTWENLLIYNKTVNDHSFGATLLQSIQGYLREWNSISVQDTPADELLYYDPASASIITGINGNKSQWQLASFMGRINYAFKDRYLLTATGRYDGSSRLAEGHKWVFFPSMALAWRISDEPFMKGFNAINDLKLRVGFGTTASSEVNPYETMGTLQKKYYNFGDTQLIGYAPDLMMNPTLGWETTGQWNVGLDFAFLTGRLSGSIDAYVQNTKNLLMDRQLPAVSGFDEVKTNIGQTRNRGIEVALSSLNVKSTNFSWGTDLMFYFNKEEIVELYNGKQDDVGSGWFIGEPINIFYSYKKVGIWQDTPEDLSEMAKFNENGSNFIPGSIRLWDNGDYKITEEDRLILGKARPDFTFSVNNTFQYRDFDLSIFLTGSFGSMLRTGVSYMSQAHRSSGPNLNYWTPANPTNDFPRPIANVGNLDYNEALQYEDADYLKLRNITLGYTLPERIVENLSISRCRIYLQTQNPWMWTTYSLVDPEGVNSNVDGDNYGFTRPTPTTWALGIDLSF